MLHGYFYRTMLRITRWCHAESSFCPSVCDD